MDSFEPQKPQNRKEYAFALNNGQYRFLIEFSNDIVSLFITGEGDRECCLCLSVDEYQIMVNNFASLPNFLQGTEN